MRVWCVDERYRTQEYFQPSIWDGLAFVRSQSSAGQYNAAHGREQITGFKLKLNNGRVRRPRRPRVHHVHRRALRHGLRGRVHRLRRVQSWGVPHSR